LRLGLVVEMVEEEDPGEDVVGNDDDEEEEEEEGETGFGEGGEDEEVADALEEDEWGEWGDAARGGRARGDPGRIIFPRTKGFFLKVYTLMPLSKLFLRHVRFDDAGVQACFTEAGFEGLLKGASLFSCLPKPPPDSPATIKTLFKFPDPRKGFCEPKSVTTNGTSLCVQYKQVKKQLMSGNPPVESPPSPEPFSSGASTPSPVESPPSPEPFSKPFSSGASTHTPSPLGTTTVNVTTLISNDPGRVNIAQTARAVLALGSPSLQLSFLRFTRKQWRDDCHAERRLSRAARWCKNLEREHASLSAPGISPKTASLENFAEYMRVFDSTRHAILREKSKKRWGNAEFRAWRAGKVSLSRFWGRVFTGTLEEGTYKDRGVHLAYGSAKFSSAARGSPAVPTTAAFKAAVKASHADLQAGHGVGPQSEFGSTADCPVCTGVQCKVRTTHLSNRQEAKVAEKEAAGIKVPWYQLEPEINGLKFCANPACAAPGARLKSRDRLASTNQLMVLLARKLGCPIPSNLDKSQGAPKRVYPPPVFK